MFCDVDVEKDRDQSHGDSSLQDSKDEIIETNGETA